MDTLQIRTNTRAEFVDITARVAEKVREIGSGICLVYCPHTTAGLTINENADPSVRSDMIAHLGKLIPEHAGYRHAEGNSDAHIKASLMGSSLRVIVEQGRLMLGTWQGIYFCEFDGPRTREVYIKVIEG